jgi:peptidoglycan/LPS O-acetylase OafA/YrhL
MAFHSTHDHPNYRPDIDGLRAVAVLAVVFYHAGLPGFSGGFVGVDVFFVISGFLITGIVWSEIEEKRFSLRNFYARRIRRIFPALFAVLFMTSIAALFLLIPRDLADYGKSLNGAIFFYSNFHFLKLANYFDGPAIEKPLLHTWSLSVEEQFYAIWPLILLALSRTVAPRRIIQIIAGLAVVSLILAEARLPDYQKDAFYLPWCRMWELLLGAGLAVTSFSLKRRWLAAVLGATGLAGIVLAVAFYDPQTRFPGISALLPCGGAALLIATGSAGNPVSRLLSVGPMRQIGLISYSLYLIHWPLFSFAHLYLSEELTPALSLGIVALSLLLSYLSWRFIETPFRTASVSRLAVFGRAAAAMTCLCIAGVAFSTSGGFPSRVGQDIFRNAASMLEISKYCRPVSAPGVKGGTVCQFGEDRGGDYDLILWGDSHAAHYLPAIAAMATARKQSGALIWTPGCHPFLDDTRTSRSCREFNAAVARFAVERHIKLAILGARWTTHRKNILRYMADADAGTNSGGLAKTLAFLNGRGIEVAVLDQTPYFPKDISLCVVRAAFYERDSEPCVVLPRDRFLAQHRDLVDYFAYLKKKYRFTVASSADALCNEERCRAREGDALLMADSNHLSETGAIRAIPYLKIPMLSAPKEEEAVAARSAPAAEGAAPPL